MRSRHDQRRGNQTFEVDVRQAALPDELQLSPLLKVVTWLVLQMLPVLFLAVQ